VQHGELQRAREVERVGKVKELVQLENREDAAVLLLLFTELARSLVVLGALKQGAQERGTAALFWRHFVEARVRQVKHGRAFD
jgi:hypothetical protein